MRYYFCHTCQEDHAVLEESDLAKRAVHCDIHGHVKNCVTPPKYNKDGIYHCAFCDREITKEQYEKARNSIDTD